MSTSYFAMFKEARKIVNPNGTNSLVTGVKIGQRSCGWKFQMETGDCMWGATREDITKWFYDNCVAVYTEGYGGKVGTIEDFFEIVDEWNSDPNNHITPMNYDAEYSNFAKFMDGVNGKKFREKGYDVVRYGFENDGLVWVTFQANYV